MRTVFTFVSSVVVLATVAVANGPEATMLGTRTYATVADCAKLKRLANGGPRTADTVPPTLTAKGYGQFAGTCRFTNIDERYKDRLWTVSLACQAATGDATLRAEVWRKQPDGALTVTSGTSAATLVACPADQKVQRQ